MSEKSLRSKVIRLAHQKPELREHLLPLVKDAGLGTASKSEDTRPISSIKDVFVKICIVTLQ